MKRSYARVLTVPPAIRRVLSRSALERTVPPLAALAVVGWAITAAWLAWPGSAAGTRLVVATVLVWGMGVPVLLVAEGAVPGAGRYLRLARTFGRALWLGAGAVVLLLVVRDVAAVLATGAGPEIDWRLAADVLKSALWPLVTAVGIVALRQPLGAFVTTLGARASKISALNVTLELATLPEAQSWSGPALDDFKAAYPATATDSSGGLFRAIAETTLADYVTVDLGEGREWLTSRLFILAALVPRVRPIGRIVFLHGSAASYLGEAPPADVADALARAYPWLEQAYVRSLTQIETSTATPQIELQPGRGVLGWLRPEIGAQLLSQYLNEVKVGTPGADWVTLSAGYSEHAAWLSADAVRTLLGRLLGDAAVTRDPAGDDAAAGRTLLRHDDDFVAVVDTRGRFLYLIDRKRAADEALQRELATVG